MKKQINFHPYTEAEVVGVAEDGSVVCNLYGVADGMEYRDVNISFPAGSPILAMTDEELAQLPKL